MRALDEMPTLEKVIVLSEKATVPVHDKFMSLAQLFKAGQKYSGTHPYAYEKSCSVIKSWDMATIVYTSGTTGKPKGAIHTHHSMMTAMIADALRFMQGGFSPDENGVQLSFLPLSHTYERQCGQMQTVFTGGTIAYAEQPSSMLRDIQIFNPTWFNAVPRIYERIFVAMRQATSATPEGKAAFEKALEIGLEVVDFHTDEDGFVDMSFEHNMSDGLSEDLRVQYEWADSHVFRKVRALLGKNYRFSISASAGLPARLCRIFMAMGIRIFEGYGLTETMNAINFNLPRAVLPGSMGPEHFFHQVKLAEDGEILVRGGNLFQGYFNNPEATAEAFDSEGYFHTGDIGAIIRNQKLGLDYYKIIDRKKSIMVLDTGKNVPRAKVESRFTVAHYIEQVCAIGDERKYVSAVIVPKFDVIIKTLVEQGIQFDEHQMVKIEGVTVKIGEDFTTHLEVRKLIDQDIAEANKELEGYESIKNYHISNRFFSPELDEVTPTLKVKYSNIIKNYAREIDAIYELQRMSKETTIA